MGIGNQDQTAFAFGGSWKEFAPIALTNGLLNLFTLGIYRFWATTRERRYLWSHTRFIDDQLEWTGTGLELFIGFLIALVVFFVPILGLQFLIQALVLQGQAALAGLVGLSFYFIFLYFLTGLAIFRGLRFRLSRTSWHGIHGGSDDPGFRYGISYFWKTMAGGLALGLLIPWSMTKLWSDRWNRMSFGPHMFESGPEWGGLMKRYVLCYLAVIVGVIALVVSSLSSVASGSDAGFGIGAGLFFLSFYVVLPLLALAYYAAFFREMINTLSLSTLEFQFTAQTKDWFMLFLGNAGLWVLACLPAVAVLGMIDPGQQLTAMQPGQDPFAQNPIGVFGVVLAFLIPLALVGPFIRYRNWHFFVRHLEATGEVNLTALTQSTTADLKQGEGLLDAFDMGAM